MTNIALFYLHEVPGIGKLRQTKVEVSKVYGEREWGVRYFLLVTGFPLEYQKCFRNTY